MFINGANEIMNLGEFLQSVREKKKESLAVISERAKKLSQERKLDNNEIGKSTTYFSKIERNKSTIEPKYLPSISQIYDTDILLLLDFYSSEQSNVVILDGDKDYIKVSFKGINMQTDEKSEADYKYILPKYRLANSNLLLLTVNIEPNSSRPPHSHKGEEIIRCDSGEGVIVFPDAPQNEKEKRINVGHIIHFDSNLKHSIENRSSKPASFLIIRQLSLKKP